MQTDAKNNKSLIFTSGNWLLHYIRQLNFKLNFIQSTQGIFSETVNRIPKQSAVLVEIWR